MSRILKYKDSLIKFIKERSCLYDNKNFNQKELKVDTLLNNYTKNTDLMLPILFLTVMNSQNKKNKITVQGYYGATSMEILNLILNIKNDNENFVKMYGKDNYYKIILYLIMSSFKSIYQNLELVQNIFNKEKYTQVFDHILNIYFENINFVNFLSEDQFEINDNKIHKDLLNWYIKDDQSLTVKLLKLNQVNRESFLNYLNKTYGLLCETAFSTGWLIGGGEEKDLIQIKKISKYFTFIFKLGKDFLFLEEDMRQCKNNYSKNYIINYGLQDSYEIFMYNKQKFIEETMLLDIFTNTTKEIVDFIENIVDNVIEDTSPDIKSLCSNK